VSDPAGKRKLLDDVLGEGSPGMREDIRRRCLNDMAGRHRLLDDVVGESSPGMREDIRGRCLEDLAAKRRQSRSRGVLALAACLLVGIVVAVVMGRGPSAPPRPVVPGPKPVVTRPADPRERFVVRSRPPSSGTVVRTAAIGDAVRSRPVPEAVAVKVAAAFDTVRTAPRDVFITDDELLAFFPGRPVGLMRDAPGSARLLFLRPEDGRLFMPDVAR
jgi:hypothetical protein